MGGLSDALVHIKSSYDIVKSYSVCITGEKVSIEITCNNDIFYISI